MVTPRILYTSHKIHLLLKFIKIDKVPVNLLHKNNRSDSHKLQKFQETSSFSFPVSVYAIVTCQGVFVPVPAFTDYSVRLFSILFPL